MPGELPSTRKPCPLGSHSEGFFPRSVVFTRDAGNPLFVLLILDHGAWEGCGGRRWWGGGRHGGSRGAGLLSPSFSSSSPRGFARGSSGSVPAALCLGSLRVRRCRGGFGKQRSVKQKPDPQQQRRGLCGAPAVAAPFRDRGDGDGSQGGHAALSRPLVPPATPAVPEAGGTGSWALDCPGPPSPWGLRAVCWQNPGTAGLCFCPPFPGELSTPPGPAPACL